MKRIAAVRIDNMANTVFILGAGASKLAGVPLMNNFLDVARDLLVLSQTGEYKENFEAVFRGISKLQLVHSKSQLDIQNVESVFAAFEMAKTLGRFSNYSVEDIDFLVKSMKLLILGTIQTTFRIPKSDRTVQAPAPYDAFANYIYDTFYDRSFPHTMAVITFNYDVALDLAFHLRGLPVRYGLQSDEQASALALLKLHGSLNWVDCAGCNKVVPWCLSDYFKEYNWDLSLMDRDVRTVTMGIGSHIKRYDHGCHTTGNEPLIVPPTWNKSGHYAAIAPVWALAAQQLAEAENIFVIGYSLPQTDVFFRLLYAIGTIGDVPLNRFWVFNPDDSGETELRFKTMLGPGAIQRFKYFPMKFEHCLGDIFDSIKQKKF